MAGRRAPVPLKDIVMPYALGLEPVTPLSAVRRVWGEALGPVTAAESKPLAVRGGTVDAACSSATWAHELTMLEHDLLQKLNAELAGVAIEGLGGITIRRIRFSARGFTD